MDPAGVCAVIVTYHPDAEVIQNLRAVRPQVDWLVVVDNGSSEGELQPLRVAALELGYTLVVNPENQGIATALNQGIRTGIRAWMDDTPRRGSVVETRQMRVAHHGPGETPENPPLQGPEWFLLFDQDSRVTPGLVAAMLKSYRSSPFGDRLALLVPRYQDMRTGENIVTDRLPTGGIEAAMTSGSLIRTETFLRYGLFLDQLFIDMVDSEYSLRLRAAGRVLDECDGAVLLHSPAAPQRQIVGGRALFTTGNYSPIRHYYQQRNRVWVARHYGRRFPRYILRLFTASAKDAVKIVLAEQQKGAKLRAFAAGLRDGLQNRMGKRAG